MGFLFRFCVVVSVAVLVGGNFASAESLCPETLQRSRSGKRLVTLPGLAVYGSSTEIGMQMTGALEEKAIQRVQNDGSGVVRLSAYESISKAAKRLRATSYLLPDGTWFLVYHSNSEEESFSLIVDKDGSSTCQPYVPRHTQLLDELFANKGLPVIQSEQITIPSRERLSHHLFGDYH
ncbi:hypothetical protein MRY87_09995 [bacterium]|nr:hypothetical protein [bacterium]